MSSIPAGTPVHQVIYRKALTTAPLQIGGQQPCHGRTWQLSVSKNVASAIVPELEKYMIEGDDFPWEFIQRVTEVSSEALINAGRYGRVGTDVHVSCVVVGQGKHRRCTVQVFNYTNPDALPPPHPEMVPPPDLCYDLARNCGRGFPIMNARADALIVDNLPGHARQITLVFDLASKVD